MLTVIINQAGVFKPLFFIIITKFIDFIKANKAKIVAILTAILTFVISISEIDMGTKMGIVCSILIVVIPVIISFIEGNDMNKTITLLVNTITLIQKIVKDRKAVTEDFDGNTIVSSNFLKEFSEEEIKAMLTKGI